MNEKLPQKRALGQSLTSKMVLVMIITHKQKKVLLDMSEDQILVGLIDSLVHPML